MLAEEHSAELLEARRRVVERPDDRLALVDRERQHLRHPAEGGLEPGAELVVVDQAGEPSRIGLVAVPRGTLVEVDDGAISFDGDRDQQSLSQTAMASPSPRPSSLRR